MTTPLDKSNLKSVSFEPLKAAKENVVELKEINNVEINKPKKPLIGGETKTVNVFNKKLSSDINTEANVKGFIDGIENVKPPERKGTERKESKRTMVPLRKRDSLSNLFKKEVTPKEIEEKEPRLMKKESVSNLSKKEVSSKPIEEKQSRLLRKKDSVSSLFKKEVSKEIEEKEPSLLKNENISRLLEPHILEKGHKEKKELRKILTENVNIVEHVKVINEKYDSFDLLELGTIKDMNEDLVKKEIKCMETFPYDKSKDKQFRDEVITEIKTLKDEYFKELNIFNNKKIS